MEKILVLKPNMDIGSKLFSCEVNSFNDENLTPLILNTIEKNIHEDYIIICKSEHMPLTQGQGTRLDHCLKKMSQFQGDVLLGNISQFDKALEADHTLFWVTGFKGAEFIVLFKKIFKKILVVNALSKVKLEDLLTAVSDNAFVIYPFLQNSPIYQEAENILEELAEIKKYYTNGAHQF